MTEELSQEKRALVAVLERLAVQFPSFSEDDLLAAIAAAHEQFDGAKVRDFVPIFVERQARTILKNRDPHDD